MKRNPIILTASLAVLLTVQATAQTLTFGINVRQEPDDMPKGFAPPPETFYKGRVETATSLVHDRDGEYIISGGWDMIEVHKTVSQPIFDPSYDVSEWYNATVPGTVLTTLVDRGVYPDPYIGLNNLYIPDTLCRMDWWYRVRFDIPEQVYSGGEARLLLNGINYRAAIWLNGKQIGSMAGAFKRGLFEVGGLLRAKDNVLAVQILPPPNPGIPQEATMKDFGPNGGPLCMDGATFIASEGWDWMPGIRDRNIGIWQDVRLCTGGGIVIDEAQIVTDLPLPDTTSVKITVRAELLNRGKDTRTFDIACRLDDIDIIQKVTLAAGERGTVTLSPDDYPQLKMSNPKLWWPNGYGRQPLYTMKLTVRENGCETASKTIRFGIREFSYEMLADTPDREGWRFCYSPTDDGKGKPVFNYNPGEMRKLSNPDIWVAKLREDADVSGFEELPQDDYPYLTIRCNGVRIFIRGGNWGMDDAMKRVGRERMEPYFKLQAGENLNLARNWSGHCTEEVFYDLCDEYGLLVWNDFQLSTEGWNLRPLDYRLMLDNATDIVRRFRHHPSIALWCSGNETFAPPWLEERFQSLIAREDGTRHYHGNSRLLNLRHSGPWCYMKDHMPYYNDIAFGFNTEVGCASAPTFATVRKFIPAGDLWPKADTWSYHDALVDGWIGWKDYCEDIDDLGEDPCGDAPEFCRRAQVLNYNAHRTLFEAWNSRMWQGTSGVIYWMSHPAWYSVVQQTYGWDYSAFGTYYGCKKTCEPVHVQWNHATGEIEVVNTTLKSYPGTKITAVVYSPDGKAVGKKTVSANLAANATSVHGKLELPLGAGSPLLVRIILADARGRELSLNDYWCDSRYSHIPKGLYSLSASSLHIKQMKDVKGRTAVSVTNTGRMAAAYIEMNALNTSDGEQILPAYLSDSYFNLLPGETRIVIFDLPAAGKEKTIVANALNAKTELCIK